MVRPFEAVVVQHGARVLRVCRAVVGPDEAEDAWSETFISALRAYPELPDTANIEAWLVTIAHRRSLDLIRKRVRRPTPTDTLAEQALAPSDPHQHDDLYAAMRDLPDKQRMSVAYHHLGGLPHSQVAELLGCTEAAARRSCADGVKALRRTHSFQELA